MFRADQATLEEYLDLVNTANPAHSEGRVFYDPTEHALSVYNDESNVRHQLGQEFIIRVYNGTGDTIVAGSIVRYSGAIGSYFPQITLAQANSIANTQNVVGMATADIANGAYGYVTRFGKVHNINTSGFSLGEEIYLDPDTAGAITPTRPDIAVVIGFVLNVGTTDGAVLMFLEDLTLIRVYAGITYVEDETISSTTDAVNWQQKLRLSYAADVIGDYMLHWNAEIGSDSNNKGCELQLQLDDATELNYSVSAPIVANSYASVSGFKKVTLNDLNTHTFDLDYRVESTGTARIRRARMQIRRL